MQAHEDIILYRGETPSTIGFDVHGGYGETWTTDPDHALSYARGSKGILKQALLPKNAKRLVLIDNKDDYDYCWENIGVLAQLVDDPYLIRALKSGHFLYDIWRVPWTKTIKAAGYDSIATHGIEGPEEYVLNPATLTSITILPDPTNNLLTSALNKAVQEKSSSLGESHE